MAYITCENLVLGYDKKAVALPLNFSIERGDYLCILGENGSGKTTLVRTLLGLQEKLSGEILMGDGLAPNEIGWLPQKPALQNDFPASVREVVLSGTLTSCGFAPFFGKTQKRNADEQMKKMGISELSRKRFAELSGGQQQRVLLARALCAAQKLLVLDEPVAALDPDATKEFYALLKVLNDEGTAIAMVSHDIDCVQYAKHILHFFEKEIFFGTQDEYLTKYGK